MNFIKCSVEGFQEKDINSKNSPVNLDLCKTYIIYDHVGDDLFSIIFEGCDAAWQYKTKEARDDELRKIESFIEEQAKYLFT